MHNKGFEKETFKETVRENIKTLYRKTIDEATPQQIFQAVSYAVKDVIIDDWIATQKAYDEADAKTVYYMSMEFFTFKMIFRICRISFLMCFLIQNFPSLRHSIFGQKTFCRNRRIIGK